MIPVAGKQPINCDDGSWALTLDNYGHFETDENFQTWWKGGQNAGGPIYIGNIHVQDHSTVPHD